MNTKSELRLHESSLILIGGGVRLKWTAGLFRVYGPVRQLHLKCVVMATATHFNNDKNPFIQSIIKEESDHREHLRTACDSLA